MSVIGRFKKGVKKYMAEADQRADRRIAKARTRAGREKARAEIQRDQLATKREITRAETALLKAEAERKRAVRKIKDIGGGSSRVYVPGSAVFSRALRNLFTPDKPTRRKTKRTTKRR